MTLACTEADVPNYLLFFFLALVPYFFHWQKKLARLNFCLRPRMLVVSERVALHFAARPASVNDAGD